MSESGVPVPESMECSKGKKGTCVARFWPSFSRRWVLSGTIAAYNVPVVPSPKDSDSESLGGDRLIPSGSRQ